MRALTALYLHHNSRLTLEECRVVLNVKSKEEVRKLLARGRTVWLANQETFQRGPVQP